MKIYTRKGDKGETSLIGGTRVSKAHIRLEAYGNVDELNAHLGVVRSALKDMPELEAYLAIIQDSLFIMGSLLAADPDKSRMQLPELTASDIGEMELQIDAMNEDLAPLKAFILPAGSPEVSGCHVARTVCRRTERAVVRLSEVAAVDPVILEYLNRLSDFLFVLARRIGKESGIAEVEWQPRKERQKN
jgi:cob(I)alamin adenosyltransferase